MTGGCLLPSQGKEDVEAGCVVIPNVQQVSVSASLAHLSLVRMNLPGQETTIALRVSSSRKCIVLLCCFVIKLLK